MPETTWSGPDELRAYLVPLEDVQPHPRNPRQGDVGAMVLSLEAFGQYRLAVVQRSTGYIVAGSHLWRAIRSMGWTHVAVLYRDLTDREAERLMLADNRVADRGSYDQAALADLLEELAQAGELTPATGYEPDDLDDLLADLGRVPTLPPGRETPPAPPRRERQEEDPGDERVVSWALPGTQADLLLSCLARLAQAWSMAPGDALVTAVQHAADEHL